MNVIIAMDSFKGCASSYELSKAIAQGIEEVYPHASIKAYEIADGGEGTLEAMVANSGGEIFSCKVHDPLMNPIMAQYGILGDQTTCVIEMARASGLPLVPKEKRNPLLTTTFGVGELIRAGLEKGCRKFIVGIGGSATNDAGVGMLQALGFSFLDKDNQEVGFGGGALANIVRIDTSKALSELASCTFTIACDVDNPMYGKKGAAHIYAHQKGATKDDIIALDAGVEHFAGVIEKQLKKEVANVAGSGAAGALGGGFLAFLNATLCSGIDIVLEGIHFDKQLEKVDFVITGEGRIDAQSLMGKVISGIAKRCVKAHVPLIALAGGIEADALKSHESGVSALFSILQSPMSLEEAMNKETTLRQIKQSTAELFRLIYVARLS